MEKYQEYLNIFQKNVSVLPEPYLDRFFPEAFVTREELINLIMLLDGKDEQISTSMVVDKD